MYFYLFITPCKPVNIDSTNDIPYCRDQYNTDALVKGSPDYDPSPLIALKQAGES